MSRPYEYITRYTSPNFSTVRNRKIDLIVIHHWGILGQRFLTPVNWLCRPNGSSSAHYVVESGRVACLVAPKHVAWHAGNWPANVRSIGIECRPEATPGDFETVAQLIAELRNTYGYLPLAPHKQFQSTACPGKWEAMLSALDARAEQLRGKASKAPAKNVGTSVKDKVTSTKAQPSLKSLDAVAQEVIDGKWGNGADRRARLTAAGYSASEVQARVNAMLSVNQGKEVPRKSTDELAREVIAGKWGNDPHRSDALRKQGYDPRSVQNRVNDILAAESSTKKSVDTLAQEVINGSWGNGADRKARLEKAGYNYSAVQQRVNELLR